MVGAGEVKLPVPAIPANTRVDVDIDFPPDWLPNVSLYPVAKDTRNDSIELSTIKVDNNDVIRARFHANKLKGLFGDQKMAVIINPNLRRIYVQKVESEGDLFVTRYNVNSAKWGGVPQRLTEMVAEGIAGWEIEQQLKNPTIFNQNPAYQLALWLDKNREKAATVAPSDLLQSVVAMTPNRPKESDNELAVDVDQVEKPDGTKFPPSLGVVAVTAHTTNDRALVSAAVYQGKPSLRFAFRSEVDLPELGQKHPAPYREGELDAYGTRVVLLTEQGIKVFEASDKAFKKNVKPTFSVDRLSAILAGALIAVGVQKNPPAFATALIKMVPEMTSAGSDFLPPEERVEAGKDWLSEHPGFKDFLTTVGASAQPATHDF